MYEASIYYFKQASEADKNNIDPYINLGNVYTLHKNYTNAIQFFELAHKIDQTNLNVINNLSFLYNEIDKLIESKILKLIDKYFPDHQISGEEFGQKFSNSKYKWVIDPIDGTKALVCGQPTWSNLIGLIENDYPKMGLANFPILKKYYYSDSINSYCCNKNKKIINQKYNAFQES